MDARTERAKRDKMTVDLEPIARICRKYDAVRGGTVMLLQDIQGCYGYLPREVLQAVSSRLNIPQSRLYGLATFYRAFSLEPRGRHEIKVCTGTACHVRGAEMTLESFERALGIKSGETTADGLVTLVNVNCLGACALGPVVVLDGDYHGGVTSEDVADILKAVEQAGSKERQ
jgi:NADH-quinone oxidoreductase subunit E